MVKFTRGRDELLIELVKGHRILFDASDENFKNNILKHKSWEEISAIVGVSECKKRWKSLRDQYNKKKRGDLTGAERFSSTWEYMSVLSFLSDTAEKRDNGTKTDNNSQQGLADNVEAKVEDGENGNGEKRQLITDEDGSAVTRRRRMTRRRFRPITKIMAKRRQRSAFYERMLKMPEVKTPTQKFFESMADIVDQLPTNLQAETRLKVCQTVTEAELKHHTQNAVLYPNLQSQFTNIIEYPNTPSTPLASNATEYVHSPIPSNKLKEDMD